MTISTRARTRLMFTLVAIAAAMFMLMPAAPASAGQVTGLVQGEAVLSGGIGTCGTGTFSGTATGVHGTDPAVAQPVSASFSYCNPDTVAGTASGDINIAGHACTFAWERTGLTAVVTISGCHTSGTAIAEFVPASTNNTFQVVGEGVF